MGNLTAKDCKTSFIDVFEAQISDRWANCGAKWRSVGHPGVFAQGVCLDDNCDAKNQMVICCPGMSALEYKLDLVAGIDQKMWCPCCGGPIVVASLGFSNCFYRVTGVKLDESVFSVNWTKVGDECKSWALSNKTPWVNLEVFVRLTSSKMEVRYAPMLRESDVCAICVEPLEDTNVKVILHCRHVYHEKCLDQWNKFQKSHRQKPTCPLCRQPCG